MREKGGDEVVKGTEKGENTLRNVNTNVVTIAILDIIYRPAF
jgi:hypothetical protein